MNQFEGIHPAIISKLRTPGNFTDEEIIEAFSYFDKRNIKRKEIFLRAGDICRTKGYINKGCFRRYTIDDHGKEIIINFALEEWWIGDLESFNTHKPTIYFVQALEDSELFCISEENHLKLCEVMPKYHAFHERKAESSHCATLKRLTLFQSRTP